MWARSKMPQKSIARQKTEATPGNYWGLPIKGPGFLLQSITAVFWTAAMWARSSLGDPFFLRAGRPFFTGSPGNYQGEPNPIM